jgi:AcrR family transcriptional regulator
MPVSDATPLRADAQRNLERILEAARLSFAEYGLDVGVEAIARRAGVGKATFFRRFPTKDALVEAVMEGFIADLEALAAQTSAMADPWDGLRCFIVEHARMQADNAGFFDAMAARFSEGQTFPQELFDR